MLLVQTEYAFAMKTGTFPLNIVWHNVQNNLMAGLTGVFHPLLHIATRLPGYATGNALDWVIFLHLAMLAVAHLALFRFLQKFLPSTATAFFLSLITVYSPRLLLSFSLAGATTVWSGYLLLCTAVGFYYLNPSRHKGPLSIIGLSYWLISSGFPQEIYFSLLGTGLFILFIPFLLAAVSPDRRMTVRTTISFWGHTAAYCLIGALLSAAFLFPFLADIFKEVALSRQPYEEAAVFSTTVPELLNNFFLPLRLSPSGLIGGSPLLPAAMIIPFLALCRIKIPGIIWIIWGTALFLLICMLGDNTPVHYYIWKYVPFYSVTRYASRASMVLPILFMLLLIWLFSQSSQSPVSLKTTGAAPLTLLSAMSLLITVCYIFFMITAVETLPPSLIKINLEIIPAWAEPLMLATGIFILIIAAVHGLKTNMTVKALTGLMLCVVTCFQLAVLYRHAPMVRTKMDIPENRTFEQYLAQKRQHIDVFLGSYILGFEKILYPDYAVRQWEQAGFQPLPAKIYEKHISARDITEAYAILNRGKKEDVLVVTGYPEHDDANPTSFTPTRPQPAGVRLTYNSYNRLVFDARAGRPSFFMFSYHRTGHWQAFVNGKRTVTYGADGNLHAVRIPAGESTVEFRYWSWAAFWGMLVSCATLAGIGLFYGVFRIRGPAGYAMAVTVMAAGGGLFGLWYHSLYTGDNLQTHYTWQAPPPDAPRNIAYGKPARASLPAFGPLRLNLIHDARLAVDGGRSFASCFSTGNHFSPWLEIDLLRPQSIGSIVIYTDLQGREADDIVWFTQDSVKVSPDYNFLVFERVPATFNLLPLTISVSTDQEHWKTAYLHNLVKREPLIVQLEKPVTGRYIRIGASGECRLCLNEVKVYPPTPDQEPISRRGNQEK